MIVIRNPSIRSIPYRYCFKKNITLTNNFCKSYITKLSGKSVSFAISRTFSSLLGVGAPEVLVVGVVALIVFGPKGLASAVKSFGLIFESLKPTIRDIESINTKLMSSIKEDIGINDLSQRSEIFPKTVHNEMDTIMSKNTSRISATNTLKELERSDSRTKTYYSSLAKKSLSNMSTKELIVEIRRRNYER